jgi:hypothetical protein
VGDIYFRESERSEKTLTLHLPAGWRVRSLPPEASWATPGLAAKITVRHEGSLVVITQALEVRAGRYPAEGYARLRDALRGYYSLAKGMVVLEQEASVAR